MAYLGHHYELKNNRELLRTQQRAKAYEIIDNTLYKTSIIGPLHCLSIAECKKLLSEIHTCISMGHIGSRALVAKVFTQGFYWSSVIDDTTKIVATYGACQNFSPHSKARS
jgi:hypothetical protein